MCNKAVREDSFFLQYVPDWFVKQHDDHCNDAEVIKWYNGYQERMVQKAQIQKELMSIAWHPSRWWNSDKVSCSNGKDCHYIVSYQVNVAPMPLFIKTPKDIFSHSISKHNKNSAYTMPFNVSDTKEWVSQHNKIWNEVELQLFEKLTTEPIKDRYVHVKLKMWKECIKTNFHGQHVPYDIYCNAMAVLKIDSVYKQGKNCYPQVYVEECKYTDVENQQCNMLSDGDDDG